VAFAQATGTALTQNAAALAVTLPSTGTPALGIAGVGLCLLIAGLCALETARRASKYHLGPSS
jgi:hypothetical protein